MEKMNLRKGLFGYTESSVVAYIEAINSEMKARIQMEKVFQMIRLTIHQEITIFIFMWKVCSRQNLMVQV